MEEENNNKAKADNKSRVLTGKVNVLEDAVEDLGKKLERLSTRIDRRIRENSDQVKDFFKKTNHSVAENLKFIDTFLEGILRIEKELLVLRDRIDNGR